MERLTVRPRIWVLALLSMFAHSCQENVITISTADALVDPRIAPTILYTYPSINSVGPYAEWEPVNWIFPSEARVEIHFSKLMNLGSVIRGMHIASSRRKLDIDTTTVRNENREDFSFGVAEMYAADYWVGEVLTLSLARPVADVNGNMIAPYTIGNLTPEPAFRIRWFYPPDGSTLAPDTVVFVTLHVNSAIDDSLLPYVSVAPSVRTSAAISEDSTSLVLRLSVGAPVRDYRLTLAAGAPDREGHRTSKPYTAVYHGVPFTLRCVPPETSGVSMNAEYWLTSEQQVDPASIRAAFHITPAVSGGVDIQNSWSAIRVRPNVEFAQNTRYVIRVDTTLKSTGSIHLPEEFTFAFRTAPFAVSQPSPRDLAAGVSRNAPIVVTFPAVLDSSTVRRSFRIIPAVAGIFGLPRSNLETNYIYFDPGDSLVANQTYSVTIDTTLRSKGGQRPASPYSFSFTTGNQ